MKNIKIIYIHCPICENIVGEIEYDGDAIDDENVAIGYHTEDILNYVFICDECGYESDDRKDNE